MTHAESSEVCYKALMKLISVSDELSDFLEASRKRDLSYTSPPTGSQSKVTEQLPKQFHAELLASPEAVHSRKTSLTQVPKKASSLSPPETRGPLSYALPAAPNPQPFSHFVNLVLCGLQPGQGRTGVMATVLIDNPAGATPLSLEALIYNVQCVFGLRGTNIRLYYDSAFAKEVAADLDTRCLFQAAIFVSPYILPGVAKRLLNTLRQPLCRYINVVSRDRTGTLLLENPCDDVLTWSEVLAQASAILGMSARDIRLSRTRDSTGLLHFDDGSNLLSLHGSTIFVL
ncbi:unnamed protein product [Candidula unifasciata]|uniref:Isoleucine--tRNA ligase cytoplasmic ubiquitin-like domain-containing protein n=1 Tax=Candidula unifasciata TaxID=100452 RepID=A0A8S3YYM2_9EUPU|nr:unnamed protein product [Candidula unifasciata]